MTEATVIYGPPGTGKTTTLCRIIAEEIERVGPERIVIVSHTKAAAAEIAHRAGGKVRAGTVHSFAFGLAFCKKGSVMDTAKYRRFGESVGIPVTGNKLDEAEEYTEAQLGDEYLGIFGLSMARMEHHGVTYAASHRPGNLRQFDYFVQAYGEWKAQYGYYDFNDMLVMARGKLIPGAAVIIVDEAQDLSPAQWELVRHWANNAERVYVAGDDDQAIYVWGGADPRGMSDFEASHRASRRVLAQSYRIPSVVHDLAATIIGPVRDRVAKEYKPREAVGRIERRDGFYGVSLDEAESTLILYRNHSLRKEAEEWLMARRVPHVFDNGGRSALQSPLAMATRAYDKRLRWTDLSSDERWALARILSTKDLEALEIADVWKTDPMKASGGYRYPYAIREYLAALRSRPDGLPEPESVHVHLSSIHGAKGREADHVVLINGVTPRSWESWEKDQDGERRVFYVGVTRAKQRLTIVQAENALPI